MTLHLAIHKFVTFFALFFVSRSFQVSNLMFCFNCCYLQTILSTDTWMLSRSLLKLQTKGYLILTSNVCFPNEKQLVYFSLDIYGTEASFIVLERHIKAFKHFRSWRWNHWKNMNNLKLRKHFKVMRNIKNINKANNEQARKIYGKVILPKDSC